MSQPMIILYDVPSTDITQPWAPNVWRIRLILNYKRLPYRTCWVEFPEIERTLRSINAPPTSVRPDGRPVYTLPAILDPTRSTFVHTQRYPVVLTQANTIMEYLERTYPARPVIPEGTHALQALFVHYITEIFAKPLLPIMVPLSHQRLPVHIQRHFHIGAASVAGPLTASPISSVPHAGAGREESWAAVRAQFAFLASILDKNASTDMNWDGVVVMGHDLTYADFAVCSVLIWIEKVAPREGWMRVREWDGGRWGRLWDRCRGYMDVY